MTPPEEEDSGQPASPRGRRRAHQACLTCRRKKIRCPREKPACSSCVRLQQQCLYPTRRPSQSGRSDERLQHLEEKLDLILHGGNLAANRLTHQGQGQGQAQGHGHGHGQSQAQSQAFEAATDTSEDSYAGTPPAREQAYAPHHLSSNAIFDSESANMRPSQSDMAIGVNLYFKFCHRQPIWCLDREDIDDLASIPEELGCSILALTSRFSEKRDYLQLYGNIAKTLIMLRIANGTVDLTTIESLCLLSYASFLDGNNHLGQFHLGLCSQLCRSAMLDTESAYAIDDETTERKKRLFWSLQVLEQSYGRQDGLLTVPTGIWRPAYSAACGSQMEKDAKAPPLPRDELGTTPNDPGIWNTSIHLGWVWSQVRKYVFDCSRNDLKEPWRHDSMYAKVVADFLETENRIPMCHRYDSVKFYERKVDEIKVNRDYWAPWLKEQFTYHSIPMVLNHPFLYIVGAQHNPNLGIPNTFWRRSSEQALLHATWIVRMIDMVVDKRVPLVDPFFGHVAAISATVHLYYCCAAAARLKHKSNRDFAKCRRFLKSFIPHSAACGELDRNLDKMTRIAAGSENMDVEDWVPSKIYLSVPLMWHILQFNSTPASQDKTPAPAAGILDASLAPTVEPDDDGENSVLEIVVATSPEITINTADGGQDAPTMSYKRRVPSSATSSGGGGSGSGGGGGGPAPSSRESFFDSSSGGVDAVDSLTFNTTPWLYADSSQLVNIGDMAFPQSEPGAAWYQDDDFNNLMLNPI